MIESIERWRLIGAISLDDQRSWLGLWPQVVDLGAGKWLFHEVEVFY